MEPEMDYKFSKAELAEFKRFWESETGKKYLGKIKNTKEQLLDAAMGSMDADYVIRTTAIANGFQSVLTDVEATIKAADNKSRKEAKKE